MTYAHHRHHCHAGDSGHAADHPANTTTPPPSPRSRSPGRRCPSSTTHNPGGALSPTPATPHRAHRRPARRAVRACRVILGWLDTHPHPYAKRLLVMTGLDLDYPTPSPPNSAWRRSTSSHPASDPRRTPHAAAEGSHWLDALLQQSLLVALGDNRRHLRPIRKFVARLCAERGLPLTITRHTYPSPRRRGKPYHPRIPTSRNFRWQITGEV
jgi:hypothetical protein